MGNIIKFLVYVVLGLIALTLVITVIKMIFGFTKLLLGMLAPLVLLVGILYLAYLLFGRGSNKSGSPRSY